MLSDYMDESFTGKDRTFNPFMKSILRFCRVLGGRLNAERLLEEILLTGLH